jgi:hypothetical protein
LEGKKFSRRNQSDDVIILKVVTFDEIESKASRVPHFFYPFFAAKIIHRVSHL